VAVTICQNDGPPTSTWDPARAERDRRSYDRWIELVKGKIPLYVWTHYCYVSPSLSDGFPYPNSCTWRTPEYMARLQRDGIRGMFIEHGSEFNESFLLSQMELYLSLQLGFDGERDGAALAEEFFPRYYGQAGKLMRQLYWELAKAKFNLQDYPEEVRKMTRYNSMTPAIACYLLTSDRVERWGGLVDQAMTATTGVEHERVLQYKVGVWDRMMASRSAFLNQAVERVPQPAAIPETVAAIADPCEEAACVPRWPLVEPGERMLAGAASAPHTGNDCLKVIPGNVVQDKKRTILRSQQRVPAALGQTVAMSCAARSDADVATSYLILDCFDANGKLLKAIWKPLKVGREWASVAYDIPLDAATVGAAGLATVGLRLLCAGDGAFYLDDIALSIKEP
jgi:hypothetical protein